MVGLRLILDGDGALPELGEAIRDGRVIEPPIYAISALPKGTSGGHPSVAIIIQLPNGDFVHSETTLKLFLTAARAFAAKYGPQYEDILGVNDQNLQDVSSNESEQ